MSLTVPWSPVMAPAEASQGTPRFYLTPRQLEVLALLCEGHSNKVIGARLNVSIHTVKVHVASILRELGASSRLEAVVAACRRGLVDGALPGAPVTASPCAHGETRSRRPQK